MFGASTVQNTLSVNRFYRFQHEWVCILFAMIHFCIQMYVDISYTLSTINIFSKILWFNKGERYKYTELECLHKHNGILHTQSKQLWVNPTRREINMKTSKEIEWRSPMRTVQVGQQLTRRTSWSVQVSHCWV